MRIQGIAVATLILTFPGYSIAQSHPLRGDDERDLMKAVPIPAMMDCNHNGIHDEEEDLTDANNDQIPDECEPLMGDVDQNGILNAADCEALALTFGSQSGYPEYIPIWDRTGDRRITTEDVMGSFCELYDGDGDGIQLWNDPCPSHSNASSSDTDNDGIYDDCQCGDADGDGAVTIEDLGKMHQCMKGEIECDRTIADADGRLDSQGDPSINSMDLLYIFYTTNGKRPTYRNRCLRRPEGIPAPPVK